MRKIPTVLQRDPDDRARVLDEIAPGCEWVLTGEGAATRKYDGTCVRLHKGSWWARREVKAGKANPPGFQMSEVDAETGKVVGWIPMPASDWNRWFTEAFRNDPRHSGVYGGFAEGTYELVGPKINGNPEALTRHELIRHADAERPNAIYLLPAPWSTEYLRDLVRAHARFGWEGIVWHHPDGRMAKLKARDLRESE